MDVLQHLPACFPPSSTTSHHRVREEKDISRQGLSREGLGGHELIVFMQMYAYGNVGEDVMNAVIRGGLPAEYERR